LNEKGAQQNSVFGSVKWNFHKFLIGKDGKFIDYFAAITKPTSKKVIKAIEKALAA
jgi:glutathione peroxidase